MAAVLDVCIFESIPHFQISLPWSDLDLFYGKVKFGNLGFSIGKSENSGFFRNY